MIEKEYTLKRAEAGLREQISKVEEARRNLEHGVRKAQAEFDQSVLKLKGEVERHEITLEKEKHWVEFCKSELERGFTT